jgi:hypothetical protein
MQTALIVRRDVPWIAAKCEFDSNPLPGRACRWSFFLTAMGLCSVSGCWSHGASETYTLFIDAEVFSFRRGLSLDVRGRCDGASFTRLRLHFESARATSQKR